MARPHSANQRLPVSQRSRCVILARCDTCFSDFVSPMTNPLFFEDPRTLSEIRFMFHSPTVPNTGLGGGKAQVYAAQIRMALNDEQSIIATKDGWAANHQPSESLLCISRVRRSTGLRRNDCRSGAAGMLLHPARPSASFRGELDKMGILVDLRQNATEEISSETWC